MGLVNVADMRDPHDPQGRTYRQVNLETTHKYPVGTLVEVKINDWLGEGACMAGRARLWVVAHDRDCDGTPLYTLSHRRDPCFLRFNNDARTGYGEESLMPIEVTPAILDGSDVPEWLYNDEEENEEDE